VAGVTGRTAHPWTLPAIVACAAVLLGVSLGAAPLERAEIYFVDAARAMAESGDWRVPRYRGEPFFDKPPLTYWLMAAAFEAFGPTLGAARLVPVTAALLLLAATAWLGQRLFDRDTGLAGALALGSTLLFLSFGRVAMSDMLLALWTTLSVALAFGLHDARAARRFAFAAALGAALGLGFLTKGPIALILAGSGIAAWWWAERRLPRLDALAATGAVFAAVAAPWFFLVHARMGSAPLAYFFLRENLERFAGETYDSGRPAYYYLGAYLAVGLPWSLVFPRSAWRLPRGERTILAWLGLMLVPLSLARGKIDYYLLPLAPAASLVVARWLVAVPWNRGDRVWARGAALAFAAIVAAVPLLGTRLPTEWLPSAAGQVALLAAGIGGALLALAAVRRPEPRRLAAALAAGSTAAFLLLAAVYLPAFRAAQPNAAVVEDVVRERRYRSDATLAFCGDAARVQRDVLFEARLAALERCDLWSLVAAPQPYLLVLSEEEFRSLGRAPNVRPIAEYRALPATALTLDGLLRGMAAETVVLAANFATDDPVAETKRKKDRKRLLREDDPSLP
jgi:4-amino-4-deoxy-L-arabinose transferase-like glycosyltransferase